MNSGESSYGLTPRDLAVLKDLAGMRYLKTPQIQTLHFPSRRVTNRRLEVLFREGYTDRFRLPTLVGKGSSEYIYCLTEQGGECVSTLDGLEPSEIHRPQRNGRPKNFFLMEHHLAINDFWIALEHACEKSDVRLAQFIPEYYGERTDNGGLRRVITDSVPTDHTPGEKVRFIPDAVFILERAGRQALFFLEIDRGTEKIISPQYTAFLDKVALYASYYQNGGFKRWGEQFKGFRVLVVTTSEERERNLLLATREIGIQKLLWFTTRLQVTAETLFKAIWQVPTLEGSQALHSGAS